MYTEEAQAEAIRAVARSNDILEELNTNSYDLLQALQLINIHKSDVTCLGICKNGVLCQRHIADGDAVKGLLGIIRVVYNPGVVGEERKKQLQMELSRLLCPHKHQGKEEAAACVERKMGAVEEFRSLHGIVVSSTDGYREPVRKPVALQYASVSMDWEVAYMTLAAKVQALEVDN